MTKLVPYRVLLGHIPHAQATLRQIGMPIDQRREKLESLHKRPHNTILYSQMMMIKDTTFKSYQEGDLVWLDVKNLKTTHPSHKLRAKRYGLFKIINVLSHMTYRLQLPPSWKIHNVFHTSYLSQYQETKEHGPNYLEPPPDIIEGQPE